MRFPPALNSESGGCDFCDLVVCCFVGFFVLVFVLLGFGFLLWFVFFCFLVGFFSVIVNMASTRSQGFTLMMELDLA